MSDHAENTFDTPIDHRLGHDVCHGARMLRFGFEANQNAFTAYFHGETVLGPYPRGHRAAFQFADRNPKPCQGQRIQHLPSTPCSIEPSPMRTALMWTVVVHRRPLTIEVRQAERAVARRYRLDADPPASRSHVRHQSTPEMTGSLPRPWVLAPWLKAYSSCFGHVIRKLAVQASNISLCGWTTVRTRP